MQFDVVRTANVRYERTRFLRGWISALMTTQMLRREFLVKQMCESNLLTQKFLKWKEVMYRALVAKRWIERYYKRVCRQRLVALTYWMDWAHHNRLLRTRASAVHEEISWRQQLYAIRRLRWRSIYIITRRVKETEFAAIMLRRRLYFILRRWRRKLSRCHSARDVQVGNHEILLGRSQMVPSMGSRSFLRNPNDEWSDVCRKRALSLWLR